MVPGCSRTTSTIVGMSQTIDTGTATTSGYDYNACQCDWCTGRTVVLSSSPRDDWWDLPPLEPRPRHERPMHRRLPAQRPARQRAYRRACY